MKPLRQYKADIKQQVDKFASTGFRQIFDHIDQLGIKKSVDRMGVDKFVEQCAWLAAGSGAVAGSGGLVTMLAGIPLDMANLITQQFRVTMAILYSQRGDYRIGFDEFMSLVAVSLRVDAGVAISKAVMEEVAEKMIAKLGARIAERLVPVVGAAIGGTANYLFIKRMAETVKKMHFEPLVQSVRHDEPIQDAEIVNDDTSVRDSLKGLLRRRNKGK